MEDLGDKEGDLQAMDVVRVVGLTSEKGQKINGRTGTVRAIAGENDGTANPFVARMPDGRYSIEVELAETANEEIGPGRFRHKPKTKTYSLKRENLERVSVGIGSIARTREGAAQMRAMGLSVETTAEGEARDPGVAGWFPAILQGDAKRTREILEHVRGSRVFADGRYADFCFDATGDTALTGAIQKGHLDVVKVLVEFGTDVNRISNMPMMREYHLSYFNMAVMLIEQVKNGEEIFNFLVESGADVNSNSIKGTPLALATLIKSDHNLRMRVCRKLLEKGADPNVIMNSTPPRLGGPTESTVLAGVACREVGNYTEANRLELLKLLLDFGADPGQELTLKYAGRYERCTPIHNVASRRQAEVMRLLLSTGKGKAAVDIAHREWIPADSHDDGETALTMVVGRDLCECQANRDIAVQLLAAGANPDIKNAAGISPSMWLNDPDPEHAELKRLVKKSKGKGSSFWDLNSPEIKAFIESGVDSIHQCAQCLIWSDQLGGFAANTKFSRCSKCKRTHYCTKQCQQKHWKQHKKVCQPSDAL